MQGVVDIDGVLCPADQARISVFDRGFLYGDGAFEVMRTYGGRAFRERQHLERLARSCELLRIALPGTLDALSARIATVIEASGLGDCYLRVVVTRGVAPMGLSLSLAQQPSLLIYALPLSLPPPEVYQRGIRLGTVRAARATDDTSAVGAKTSNYLGAVLALEEARARGCDDALVIGPHGEVIEGATSNVFVVRGGAIATPPVSSGLLAGITRRAVIELCQREGIPCVQRTLGPTDLYEADEVFITSSIRELVPAVAVDGVRIGDGAPGPLTLRLLAAYREEANAGA